MCVRGVVVGVGVDAVGVFVGVDVDMEMCVDVCARACMRARACLGFKGSTSWASAPPDPGAYLESLTSTQYTREDFYFT
eukprot:CAMPEP_0119355064 /NCGR_PEP_ID=MMETSP1334-20130426/3969_1 /TAXON_ID=127549 /ORGANISM="Calcidiscus leptoporus, Strain RCC1130" /LENGTH=78 /DNA_ID=CAMNT_0007368787 /DNA_START=297 /DNA_END=529 /DNA_ORIENTATION=+